MLMTVPLARALGGRNVRKRRAGLAQAENGLNFAVISVMNLVIILGGLGVRAARQLTRCLFYVVKVCPFSLALAKVSPKNGSDAGFRWRAALSAYF